MALIAGMFEDPSAITRGWRENPVHFGELKKQLKHVGRLGPLMSHQVFEWCLETNIELLDLRHYVVVLMMAMSHRNSD